jgi:hypothetical protein
VTRPPTAEELAAIAAAYLRVRAADEAPAAPPSRWQQAARALDAGELPERRRAAGRRP